MEEILKRAIATWGPEIQQTVAIEECSEVIKEICKYLRGQYSKLHMAEEIADLEIMLEQLTILHGRTNVLASFTSNSMLEVIDDISYLQSIIPGTIVCNKLDIKCIKSQIEVVYVRLEWMKKHLGIEKLVDVYVKRKVERLEERLNKS